MSEKKEPSVNNHTPINQTDRNLSDVFKELQEIRYSQTNQVHHSTSSKNKSKSKILFHAENNRFYTKKTINLSNIVICFIVLLLIIIAIFPKNVFSVETELATDNSEETIETASIPANVELNRQAFNMQKIIAENSNFEKVKEQVSEEREIEYETQTQSSSTLPRGEQIVQQQGIPGKENVSLIKTYENGEFIEEIILSKETLSEPTPEILSIGTSDFLANLNIHIGDSVYLTTTSTLRKEPSETSEGVAEISKYQEVKLLDLPNENWCKVSFNSFEGYLLTNVLTSISKTPNIIELSQSTNPNSWQLLLVNKNNKIPENFDVELESVEKNHKVDKRIASSLKQMLSDARNQGLSPVICSSYRTNSKQTQLFNNKVKQYTDFGYSNSEAEELASYWVTIPGTSEHEIGLAVDIVSKNYQKLDEKQEETAEQKWLMENSYKYGFILRYPTDKKDITMINYEPWHYRYVGIENATYIKEHDLCLEEYIEYLNNL